jgi:peptide/nickel transport system permease protein
MSYVAGVASSDVTGGAGAPADAPKFLRRLLRRPLALACIAYLLLVVGVAIVAPIVMPGATHESAGDLLRLRQGPSLDHLLGTDSLGRDVLDRLLVGTRPVVVGMVYALLVQLGLSIPIGLAAGYFGGWFDGLVGRWVDISIAIPLLVMVLVVLSVFPNSLVAAMVAFGVVSAPASTRIIRAATLPVRDELYVSAARVSGLSRPYIVFRHVMPRIGGVVIVQATLAAASALLLTNGLAFLGVLGATEASWGGMFKDGTETLFLQPWLIWPPGLAIAITGLALMLLGDAVRDTSVETWAAAPVRRRRVRRTRTTASALQPLALDRLQQLLAIEQLTVTLPTPTGRVPVLADVSLEVGEGEVVGLVGESGCGKTMTAMAILGLLPAGGEIAAGRILYHGCDLSRLSERDLERVRGREIALISQEPMVSLNPTFRIGWQIAQAVRHHQGVSRSVAREKTVELLRRVHLPEPELVARSYVHQLSGGMAQRVAIARALAGDPLLLIADEPTTALDVTVQGEILELLRELQHRQGMAILLVTHDWGVVADLCDRAVVMYAGEVVEQAPVGAIFQQPLHPYTEALLQSDPHRAPEARVLPTIRGSVPRPGAWPSGCHFHPRCGRATAECAAAPIALEQPTADRATRCIHYEKLADKQVVA